MKEEMGKYSSLLFSNLLEENNVLQGTSKDGFNFKDRSLGEERL